MNSRPWDVSYNHMVGDKGRKPKVDEAMVTAGGDGHFTELLIDEYPATKHLGANNVPFIIGVAGGSASGKTTVCDMIIQQLHDHRVVLINQDSFYRGLTPEELAEVSEYYFDHPYAFDTEALLDCLEQLKANPIKIQEYESRVINDVPTSFAR